MYAVVVFALALLSPLPFVSPFDSIVQDATAQSSTNVPFDAQSLEIVSNLDISPFGVIQNGTDGFDSIVKPRKINTFQIGDMDLIQFQYMHQRGKHLYKIDLT